MIHFEISHNNKSLPFFKFYYWKQYFFLLTIEKKNKCAKINLNSGKKDLSNIIG